MSAWPKRSALVILRSVSLALVLASSACSSRPDNDPGVQGSPGLATGPARPYGVVFVGDFGTGDENEQNLASSIRSWVSTRPFDALVTLGDNVYDEGDPSRFDAVWTRPFGWVRDSGVPVIASLGNHDVETQGGAPEIALFDMPGRWYEHRIGPMDFFVIDANDPDQNGQTQWLSEALGSSRAPWQVLVFHQPAFSCGKHGSTPEVQDELLPVVEGKGVDLVVNGHDHDYQRFAPIGGTTYVVSGGGAASLYGVGDCPEGTPRPAAWNDDIHQFLHLSATSTQIRGMAVSVHGEVLDTFLLDTGSVR